jgi:hypothetical protein
MSSANALRDIAAAISTTAANAANMCGMNAGSATAMTEGNFVSVWKGGAAVSKPVS